MAEHPLLVFPDPTHVTRARRHGGGGGSRIPEANQQAVRLAPQFQRLQDAMDQKRAALRDNTLGIQPEQVLVLETIGSIDNFVNAVNKIPGLEWLAEFEHEPFEPEHGFADEEDPLKQLNGQLFLVMTDHLALQEIRNLFDQWTRNPDRRFRRGFAKFKDAFAHLHAIRSWNADDRIRETGVLADWEERLNEGQGTIPFETQLWFRATPERQRQAESVLSGIIESLGGEILQRCVIPEITYHAVLGRIPVARVREIVEHPAMRQDVTLFNFDGIMHVRPVGQCAIRLPENVDDTDVLNEERAGTPAADPIVALFDGLPLTGHQLLNGRIVVDDPDGYESAYQAQERVHGTTMASLICHGDLNERGDPVERTLYVRPIMKPRRDFDGRSVEAVPDDVLLVDLIHRGVRRLFESENAEPPAAPSVRVVNLSVCDRARPFDREMSPLARLLDWLASKHNILFVVSAGNHTQDIELNAPRQDLRDMSSAEIEQAVIKAVAEDTRHRRLLSPAETLNGITVGSAHQDSSTVTVDHLIDPFSQMGGPSVINAHGPGYRRVIKPDLLLPGGRQLLAENLGGTGANAVLRVPEGNRPPGQQVAVPGSQGELNRTIHTRGTSNAAALASRSATLLYDVLEQLRKNTGRLPPEFNSVLLKALLVHGSDWGSVGDLYKGILHNSINGRAIREHIGHLLGYGPADVHKVMVCTDQRATVLGVGVLEDGEGAEFVLPLPYSLSSVADRRRLTITLAWLTSTNSQRRSYRVAHLWFNPKQENAIAQQRMYADHRAVQRGTVQHEVLEGNDAVPFQDGESIVIKVNCRQEAGPIEEPVRYALAVSLEVAEGIDIPIYQEIRDRLPVPNPVPVQAISTP